MWAVMASAMWFCADVLCGSHLACLHLQVAGICGQRYASASGSCLLRFTDAGHLCRHTLLSSLHDIADISSADLCMSCHVFARLSACRLPACLQVVATADLIFVFGSAAEIRDHLKNVKDSIKDRLIVPVTQEGQIDTFQVNSDIGDPGAFLVSIVGPVADGEKPAGCHVLHCRAEAVQFPGGHKGLA